MRTIRGRRRFRKKAFSLPELSLALAICAVLLAMTLNSAAQARRAALAERVIRDLDSVAAASARYYREKGAFPDSLSDLRGSGYLAGSSGDLNPLGFSYVIAGGNEAVTVSCVLPKGIVSAKSLAGGLAVENQGDNDLVSITKQVETRLWKLKYEKRHIYHEY